MNPTMQKVSCRDRGLEHRLLTCTVSQKPVRVYYLPVKCWLRGVSRKLSGNNIVTHTYIYTHISI